MDIEGAYNNLAPTANYFCPDLLQRQFLDNFSYASIARMWGRKILDRGNIEYRIKYRTFPLQYKM